MSAVIDILKRSAGMSLTNQDGIRESLELLPPLSSEELLAFEGSIPCALPEEMKELLLFCRGFQGGALEEVSFIGHEGGQCPPEIFPNPVALALDGCGNSWNVDLTGESTHWGPIFYSCHDAPVIVFQTENLTHFVEETIRFSNAPWKSEIDDAHEGLADRVWRTNPNVLPFEACIASPDLELKAFAESLDASYEFIDLRNARLGDGFSWGRYASCKRFGDKRIFACQKKKSRWERFKSSLK